MKNTKRLLALLLTLCMVLSLVPVVAAEETAALAAEDEVIIYYTNDVHTYIDKTLSYDNIADLKAKTEEQAAGVLLVDAGDHIQGTAYGSMDKGETIIELMNAAGYDLATLGNHEFDYTMEGAMNAISWAEFPYVSCNFYNEKDGVKGETVLDAYEVFTLGEYTVAIIGITTPESFTKSTPAYFQDENGNYIYGISGGTDGAELYADVQKAIDAASEEADIIIALAHLGDDPASQPWTSEEVIANTTGLDALIDGHSHSTVPMKEVTDKGGNTVILTQTGEYFDAIGRMSIAADGTITTSLIEEYTGSDDDVKELKDEWIAEIDEKLGEVIGFTDIIFDNYDYTGRLVRKQETNTGDLAADALFYLFDSMDLDVDVAIMNGGGVRNKAITGDISYKTCKEIHTFGNVACLQIVTGQQILDALEWGAKNVNSEGAENGGFLHVSGLKYTIDCNIPSTVQADDKGVWTGGPTGEYRVKDVKILQDGEYVDLDPKAQYNLAGYNYTLRDLGDGFAMFDGAVNVLDYVMEDYLVLANYVKSFPDGEITADNSPYGDLYGEGRITVIPEDHDVHNYTEYVTKEATCTEDGEATYVCDIAYCGDSFVAEIPAGHSIDLESRVCTVCGEKGTVFSDADHWAGDYIYILTDAGVVNGYPDGTFGPEKSITRAEFAVMLTRLLGIENEDFEEPFDDVNDDKNSQWYYDAVTALYNYEIINGRCATIFDPAGKITRQEMVTMLYRTQKIMDAAAEDGEVEYELSDLSQFKDADKVDAYAKEAMQWAVGTEIVNGMDETTLAPQNNATRAQVCKVLVTWILSFVGEE